MMYALTPYISGSGVRSLRDFVAAGAWPCFVLFVLQ